MDELFTIAVFFIAGVALGIAIQNTWDVTALLSLQGKPIINSSTCDNLAGINQIECMVNYVKTFFNYTIREDIPRTLADLKENGGDCYDYSRLYVNMAKEKGLLAKKIDMYPTEGNGSGHGYALIWDKNLTFYCDVDLTDYHCKYFSQ